MTTVRFLDEARDEFLDQIDYYAAENRALSDRFRQAVEAAIDRTLMFPEAGPSTLRRTRRVRVRGFPFAVIYRYEAEVITIVAVAHYARRPGYWAARLNPHDT